MRLMTPKAWSEKYFAEGIRLTEATLRRWMQNGSVPAKKIAGSWFSDEHEWLADGDDFSLANTQRRLTWPDRGAVSACSPAHGC